MEKKNEVMENTVDINDMSTAPQQDQDENALPCDLLCGTTVAFDIDAMNWEDMYNRMPELDQNILTLKTMIYDLVRMTDDNMRESAAESVFNNANDFLKSVQIEGLNYDLRPNMPIYDKALLICMDCIMIMETIVAYSQVHNMAMSAKVDNFIEELVSSDRIDADELGAMIADAKQLTDEMPLTQEQYDDEKLPMEEILNVLNLPGNHDGEVMFPSDENGEDVL